MVYWLIQELIKLTADSGAWAPCFSSIPISMLWGDITLSLQGATCYGKVSIHGGCLTPTTVWGTSRGFKYSFFTHLL